MIEIDKSVFTLVLMIAVATFAFLKFFLTGDLGNVFKRIFFFSDF